MPPKLDRCVKELTDKGYSEEEAWAICKSQLGYKAAILKEKSKQMFTGQLIDTEHMKQKKEELKKEFNITEEMDFDFEREE